MNDSETRPLAEPVIGSAAAANPAPGSRADGSSIAVLALVVTLVRLRRDFDVVVDVPMIWSTAGVNASKRCGGGGRDCQV